MSISSFFSPYDIPITLLLGLVLNTTGGGLIGTPTVEVPAVNYWFDQNGTGTGFGVAANASYDWLGGSPWNLANTGTGPVSVWSAGNNALLTGAGTGTSYTVRLGSGGVANVTLRN